jgi:hypothetical protein
MSTEIEIIVSWMADFIVNNSSCRENMQSFPYQGSYPNQVSGIILEVYQVESCQEIQAEKNNM